MNKSQRFLLKGKLIVPSTSSTKPKTFVDNNRKSMTKTIKQISFQEMFKPEKVKSLSTCRKKQKKKTSELPSTTIKSKSIHSSPNKKEKK